MTTALSTDARQALIDAGYSPGRVIGAGMEGIVVDLGDDLVAKTWHARAHDDLHRLQRFYAAVRESGTGLDTPHILRVLRFGDQTATIESRLSGRPLRGEMSDRAYFIADVDVSCVLQVLSDLQRATPTKAMTSLPVLEGEQPFSFDESFSANLAALVERRTSRFREVLTARIPDVERVVPAVVAHLREADETPSSLIHGDLIPANILVGENLTPSALLDFGFFSTVGDPRFDAAVAASIYDMYGVRARTNEDVLDSAVIAEFGYERRVLHLYRAAYALATSNCYSASGSDGHFEWCARMLERSDIKDAIGL
ncbi:phosphotransferase family protein [Nocardioides acrostichi]|uniref:Phosphotransferase n=1 Tax=Nocardioides acrostichi TaxID=2784339 RepID=A0A930V308_9ACTN|nr:phosphotransferase [Nocardioides acrostichi]MBF4163750.1 phosphotransferase [Nocardioides acrostichi]